MKGPQSVAARIYKLRLAELFFLIRYSTVTCVYCTFENSSFDFVLRTPFAVIKLNS